MTERDETLPENPRESGQDERFTEKDRRRVAGLPPAPGQGPKDDPDEEGEERFDAG